MLLTCALIVACHDDEDAGGPKPAATIPNADVIALPATCAAITDTATQIAIAVDVDPTITADRWTILAEAGGVALRSESYVNDPKHELIVNLCDGVDPSSEVTVTISGESTLPDDTTYVLFRRTARMTFTQGQKKLAYFYVDPGCAYGAWSRCSAAGETCIEGQCRSDQLGALPDYRADWRENPPNPCDDGAEPPSLELGEGDLTFVPKNDGDTVTLQCGDQGGNHVWVALRMRGMNRNVNITVSSDAPDGGIPTPTSTSGRFNGLCEYLGIQFQLFANPGSSSGGQFGDVTGTYLGKPLTITAEAQDPSGRKATVSRRVQVAQSLSPESCGSP